MGMKAIIFGALAAFVTAALIGKPAIRELHHLKFGQKILEDGPTWHQGKQNTPTMGGVIFILAILVPILICLPAMIGAGEYRPLLMLLLSLVFGAIGFIDDFTAVKKKRNKGLTAKQKFLLQIAAATLFVTACASWAISSPRWPSRSSASPSTCPGGCTCCSPFSSSSAPTTPST
jgi:phospho-N-acetylmuramoyl-pentapeptide-transferase